VIINDNLEKCQKFMKFGEDEFPKLRHDAARSVHFNKRTHSIMQIDLIKRQRVNLVRDVWKVLKRNRTMGHRNR